MKQLSSRNLNIVSQAEFNRLNRREKILHLLRLAVMAPSTHNTQPWRFVIKPDNTCKIFIDKSRRLEQADTNFKYSYVSLGALLTNMEYASRFYGVLKSTEVLAGKEGEPDVIISLEFDKPKPKKELEPHILAITKRQNYRGLFNGKKVSRDMLDDESLHDLPDSRQVQIFFSSDRRMLQTVANLTASALKKAYANQAFRREVADHINFNFSRNVTGMHGYTLRMNSLQSVLLPFVMKLKDLGPKLAKLNNASLSSAGAVIVLAARQDNPGGWIEIGRRLEKLLLKLATQDVRTSIFVASMEFPDTRLELKKIMDIPADMTPHMLFAAGRSPDTVGFSRRQDPDELTTFL